MSSPIDLLREGILGGDWQKVCDGFRGLTGNKLDPPATTPTNVTITIGDGVIVGIQAAVEKVVREYVAEKVAWADPPGLIDLPPDLEEEFAEPPTPEPPKPPKARKPPGKMEWEEEPPVDPVSARAREVRDERKGVRRADEYEKFKVQHNGPKREDGKKYTRAEPFTPGMSNTWTDDGTLAADDIAESQRLSGSKAPEPRRPATGKVEVTCVKCGDKEEVAPVFAPKSIGKGDTNSYVCNDCIRKRK